MSSINAISSSTSLNAVMSQPGSSIASLAGNGDAAGGIVAPTSAMGQCITNMVSLSQDTKGLDAMAAMVMALLLNRSNDSDNKDNSDSWAVLASLAMMEMSHSMQATSQHQIAAGGLDGAVTPASGLAAAPGGGAVSY